MKLRDPESIPAGPRRFAAYWLRDLAANLDHRGWIALIPLHSSVCVALGAILAIYARDQLWQEMQNIIALYAAGLAVNAILLAVSWAGFSRILDIMGDAEFGTWLRRHSLFGYFRFSIDFIQIVQMLAVGGMAAGLGICLTPLPDVYQRVALGFATASSLYAGWWAVGTVRIMQDISNHRSSFNNAPRNVQNIPQHKTETPNFK